MKIAAIIGSPRKRGNTYGVVEKIRKYLSEYYDDIEFEYIFLADHNLQMCKGCFNCIAQGSDKCPLKDDRIEIETKMLKADGIIVAAPSYVMGVPGIMKNFLDRFAFACHRPMFFDKAFLAVSTVGGVRGLKQTLGQLSILAAGAKSVIKLGIAMPPITMNGFDRKAEKGIMKASKAFMRTLNKKQRKLPGITDWAWFNSFKALSSYKSYQKICPADFIYYDDKREYFYPLNGHLIKRLIGRMFKVIMSLSLRLMIERE